MKNNIDGVFEKIQSGVSKLSEERSRLEAENFDNKKEVARRKLLESIVFHETRIPLEAISGVLALSPLAMGRSCVINSSAALSVMKFNAELVAYLQSFLSPEFDPDFVMETEFDFNELMFTALCSLYPAFRNKSVNISTRFYKDAVLVKADKHKLYCILLNLIDNALKFSRDGDETVVTALICEDTRTLKVEFLDHGGGFDPAMVESYFSNGKLSIELNENDPKSGLIIIHKFLEEIHAELELDSREGEGTIVTLKIRLADCFDAVTAAGSEHETSNFSDEMLKRLSADPLVEGAVRFNDKKAEGVVVNVAVIDDDAAFCEKLKNIFNEIQPALHCTFNVSAPAPSKNMTGDLIGLNPDIIFIEPVLKSLDGFDILRQIKSAFEISQIPVIAVSRIKCQVKASKLGAVEYISKPVTISAIIDASKKFVLKLSEDNDLMKELI